MLELRFATDDHAPHADAARRASAERVEVLPDRLLLYADDGEAAARRPCTRRGVEPLSSLVRRSTLEDVFLRLTGRTLVD